MFEVVLEDVLDQFRGEVIQWKSGNDKIVGAVGNELLKWDDVNRGLSGHAFPDVVCFESSLEVIGECLVQLNQIKLILITEMPDDGAGHCAGARADFENSNGRTISGTRSQVPGHRPGQKPTAGSNRASRFESFPKLTEERGVLSE